VELTIEAEFPVVARGIRLHALCATDKHNDGAGRKIAGSVVECKGVEGDCTT